MPFNEVLKTWRAVSAVEVEPPAEFPGDVLRDVSGPSFGNVEGDHPNRVAVLSAPSIF
jgi:hypothetical protein